MFSVYVEKFSLNMSYLRKIFTNGNRNENSTREHNAHGERQTVVYQHNAGGIREDNNQLWESV